MSEASGLIVIKAPTEISDRLSTDGEHVNREAFSELVSAAGLPAAKFEGMGLSVEEIERKSGYIALSIFDSDWITFAREVANTGSNIELYAHVRDDYGSIIYCALNAQGEKTDYFFEEEGDEWDQEDFDEDAFYAEVEKEEKKWLSLIPKDVKDSFPVLLPK